MCQALAWMESLREWPRAFVPLHRGNVMVKNRVGSEGYLFFPDMDNKAMQTQRMRKEKKKKKTKQNKVGKQNRLSSGFFPGVLNADREKNWEESVNIHDWASEAKQWGGSSVPCVALDLRQRAQAAQSGTTVVKLATHGGGQDRKGRMRLFHACSNEGCTLDPFVSKSFTSVAFWLFEKSRWLNVAEGTLWKRCVLRYFTQLTAWFQYIFWTFKGWWKPLRLAKFLFFVVV